MSSSKTKVSILLNLIFLFFSNFLYLILVKINYTYTKTNFMMQNLLFQPKSISKTFYIRRQFFQLFQETVLFEGRNSVKLNIASLQSGMYYLKVMDSEERFLSEMIMKM